MGLVFAKPDGLYPKGSPMKKIIFFNKLYQEAHVVQLLIFANLDAHVSHMDEEVSDQPLVADVVKRIHYLNKPNYTQQRCGHLESRILQWFSKLYVS